MKMKKYLKLVVACFVGAACLFAPPLVFSQANLQPVAEVTLSGKDVITVKQLKAKVDQYKKATGKDPTDADIRQLLDMEINSQLALQAAKKDNIKVSDAELNNAVDRMKQQMSDNDFAQAIKQQTGLSIPEFRKQLENQLIAQKYLMQKKGDLFKDIKDPTDAEIEQAYNLRKAIADQPLEQGGLTQNESVTFAAIVSNSSADAQTLEKGIGKSVQKFENKAQELNQTDPTRIVSGVMQKNAEALNLLGADSLNKVFELPCNPDSGLKGLSGVLPGKNGKYFIIEVMDKCQKKSPLKLTDTVFPYDITLHDYIKSELAQQKQYEVLQKAQDELVTELRKGKPFKINEDNLKLVSKLVSG